MTETALGRILGEVPLGRRTVLRVTEEVDHGHDVVNLRTWFAAPDGTMRPGRAGVSLAVDRVEALLAVLKKAGGPHESN